ncbi:MAG: glycosyltransferase family 2 protein [Candidatus Limivivens sp.]|nr:glycosyltransferase family 2 protein [Candidatus Limivivens sp.]
MLVSIVIPCYNSENSIKKVVELTLEEFEKLHGYQCEFVLVNDFSKDHTFDSIRELCRKYPFVKGINLSRNFGQHNAIMAGLNYAEGDLIIGMDDDLQTHPSQIPKMLAKLEEGYDLVFGHFGETKFGFLKKLTSRIASFLTWHMINRPKGIEASNFWVCRKYVRDEVVKYKNYNLYLQVLFYRTTHNIANVEIEHFAREEGKSNYTFRKLLSLWMACLNYTVVPLRIATFLGVISALGGFLGAVIIFIKRLLNPDMAVGWASLMCALFLFFGVTFLMLGIIGEYVGKAILNLNSTPQFIVREKVNVEEKAAESKE